MAELLVKAGSIVNLRDDNGDSPLIVAARTGVCQLAELLLRNGTIIMENIMFMCIMYSSLLPFL
jgi:ankyrin repeat protein